MFDHRIKSLRPFLGAKDFDTSRSFYRDMGFQETVLSPELSVFKSGNFAFYLQNAWVKDWVDNTQVFLEVEDTDRFWEELQCLGLTRKYENVRLTPVRVMDWGKECFVHDPSGILWHIGEFFT